MKINHQIWNSHKNNMNEYKILKQLETRLIALHTHEEQ